MSESTALSAVSSQPSMALSFGEPELVTHNPLLGLGVYFNDFGGYYMPPIEMSGLDTLTRANSTHRRCINFKVNQMAIVFQETGLMGLRDFRRSARDLDTFGNTYLQQVTNGLGRVVGLRHLPALNMRKGKDDRFVMLRPGEEPLKFAAGEVLHAFHYDTGQSVYGLPEWIAAINDVFLNTEATLFRRRYYKNGSHLGYILYTTDPNLSEPQRKEIEEAVRNGKGVGNFRSMYVNIPNGNDKAVQIIPVGDISQKDEFERVKNISADDIIVAHGVPPVLAGMKPDNAGGFGDIEKSEGFYRRNEVSSLVQPYLELNAQLERFKFEFDFDKPNGGGD